MKILDAQAVAWNSGSIDGYMEGYWKSDSLLFTSGGRIQKGWEATLKKYRAAYPTRDAMGVLTFSSVRIHAVSPDAAWVFGRWRLQRDRDPAGGVFTLVVQRLGNEWKIVHDHTSVDPQGDGSSREKESAK
jgi:ketosteroid isomerase-like protein